MNLRLLCSTVFVLVLSVACASPNDTAPRTDLLGDPAPPAAATRTIFINPDTKWVNVTGGDIVKFIVGDKTFAWNFNVAASVSSFDLSRVAPPGTLNRKLIAYVEPDPRYRHDGGHDR